MSSNIDISVVIPVYGCPEALIPLHDRIVNTIKKIGKSYEIVLVNDCCPKGSWKEIEQICKKDKRTIGINFSRNFGQVHATNAGIAYSCGEYVVLMDCDLQDQPEGIEKLYNEVTNGYDIVFVKRENRKDTKLTKFLSKTFYEIYNKLTERNFDGDIGNFCIVSREVVEQYLRIKYINKTFVSTLSWMGYKTKTIGLDSAKRYEGKSSYTFKKKLNLAIDMLTTQSNKPLKAVAYLGFAISTISFIFLLIQIIRYFVSNNVSTGWTSIIVSLYFIGGLILFCLGGIGIYVGNIFEQTKEKPEYFIAEILNQSKK